MGIIILLPTSISFKALKNNLVHGMAASVEIVAATAAVAVTTTKLTLWINSSKTESISIQIWHEQ